ncbi:hypothetical protein LCGC14_1266020 [marine sediment metagenome]|uniref:Uncharacterized protein n=1 Tax=marine sediment metagenome TaxID=412755 RepID=A0A0F9LKJ5_9ZZZZ
MKFYAPYKTFRAKIGGRVLLFPHGVRNVAEDNLEEIKAIKSIPIELGEIRDLSGEVVNQPPKPAPKTKPTPKAKPTATSGESKPKAKAKPKAEPQTEPG